MGENKKRASRVKLKKYELDGYDFLQELKKKGDLPESIHDETKADPFIRVHRCYKSHKPFEPVSLLVRSAKDLRADFFHTEPASKQNQKILKQKLLNDFTATVVLDLTCTNDEILNSLTDLLSKIRKSGFDPDAALVREMADTFHKSRRAWKYIFQGGNPRDPDNEIRKTYEEVARRKRITLRQLCESLGMARTQEQACILLSEKYNVSMESIKKNWLPKIKRYLKEHPPLWD